MRLLRLPQVLEITGLSRATIYLYMQHQQFPIQVKLGPKAVGWVEDEINGWIHKRIESRAERVDGR